MGCTRIRVDDAGGDTFLLELIRRGQSLEDGHTSAHDRDSVVVALTNDLGAADSKRLRRVVEDRRLRTRRPHVGHARVLGHQRHQPLRAHRFARIEHRAVRHGAHDREIFERHLRRAVFPDRDAGMRARQLHVDRGDARHPDEVRRSREKAGERGREGNRAARGQTHRHPDHDLLGDEVLEEAIREGLAESVAEGGVLDVRVERDDTLVHGANGRERGAPRLARGDEVTLLVRRSGELAVVRRRPGAAGFLRTRNGGRFGAGDQLLLELRDCAVGLFAFLERLAVPPFLAFDGGHALPFQRARQNHARAAGGLARLFQRLQNRSHVVAVDDQAVPAERRPSTGELVHVVTELGRSALAQRVHVHDSRTGCRGFDRRRCRPLPTRILRRTRRRQASRRSGSPNRSVVRWRQCRSRRRSPGRASPSPHRRTTGAASDGLRDPNRCVAASAARRAGTARLRPTPRRARERRALSTTQTDRCRGSSDSAGRTASPRRTRPPRRRRRTCSSSGVRCPLRWWTGSSRCGAGLRCCGVRQWMESAR